MARKEYLYAKTFKNGTKVKRACEICGKEFWIIPSRVKKGEGRYCSRKCFHIFVKKNWKKEKHPAWKGGLKKRICETCGKEFFTRKSTIKDGYGQYCCHRCAIIPKNLNRKQKDTDIERLIEDELIKRNIPYTKQVPLLKITITDFLLPKDTVIYCDGDYWHSLPGRKEVDESQNVALKLAGYNVFRFSGKEIKKSPSACIDKMNYINDSQKVKS